MPVSLMLRKMEHCTGSMLPTVFPVNRKHYVLGALCRQKQNKQNIYFPPTEISIWKVITRDIKKKLQKMYDLRSVFPSSQKERYNQKQISESRFG